MIPSGDANKKKFINVNSSVEINAESFPNNKLEKSQSKLSLHEINLILLSHLMVEGISKNPEDIFLKKYRDKYNNIDSSTSWLEIIENYLSMPVESDWLLIKLAKQLDLSIVELICVSIAINVEFDAMLGRVISYMQNPLGGSRPTLGLLDNLLQPLIKNPTLTNSSNVVTKNLVSGLSFRAGLIQLLNTSLPLPEQSIKISVPLALALTENEFNWPGTISEQRIFSISLNDVNLPESINRLASQQAVGLSALNYSALAIRSGSVSEACVLANLIINKLELTPLFIDDLDQAISGLGPLCISKKCIPVFIINLAPAEHKVIPEIPAYTGPIIIVCGIDGNFENINGSITYIQVPYPTVEERCELWMQQLNDKTVSEKLAADHVYSSSRINEICKLAIHEAKYKNNKSISLDDIHQISWMSEGGGLSALAEPVRSKVADDALIVRKQTLNELYLFKKRCRLREHLVDGLGATFKARYQMGVKVLFVGPSGTGKTLASSWLATQLGLPLYRVDLASVTSKYIGETEKNLSRLLAQAEMDEVILLFDEADSMFGKRTDVKDSNDRFANAQTNYLLQRIESYTGVVILTSNSRARFDDAFTRRLDMMIEFPQPEAKERRAIWLSHLGSNHSLSKKEINQLAVSCDLCGGHIRNAVLSAVVHAKSNSEFVNIKFVIRGLQGEYKKLGKQIPLELKQYLINKN